MRLGQLARKLAVKPAEIVEFLGAKQIQAEEGVNTRLEDAHITLIMQQFAPSMTLEAATAEEPIAIEEPAVIEPLPVEAATNETRYVAEEDLPAELSSSANQSEEEKELIKAPKVELPGLKVLGKIELPDPAKKKTVQPESTEPVVADTPPATTTPRVERKPRPEGRKNSNHKTERKDQWQRKNPVALQREREAQEAEKKRQAQAELEKERRTQHYLKKVKVSGPTKAAKLYNEDVVELSGDLTPAPKTWLGKFFRWFKS